ncbi:hypothetical protein [Acuticoccus sp.]|uniref:hypothetical protein n=1 Tax=Acuticoccus sp. TaxID=1904378 RepID=UPI003B522DCF
MHARRLSFTTFNLYTLNRPDQRMDRDADGWTEKRYARNIAWTRFSIRNARVDVFGFQSSGTRPPSRRRSTPRTSASPTASSHRRGTTAA